MEKIKVEYPKVMETFKSIGSWDFSQMSQAAPSCFNGIVRIKKYKVTVEEVNESNEVYEQRIEQLWINSQNHHDFDPLQKAAIKIGYKFKGKFGLHKK